MNKELIEKCNVLAQRVEKLEAQLKVLREQEPVNTRLLERISDAMQSYERHGAICTFEGSPMIYASTLTEIADIAARAESAIETPAKVSPCAGHATQQDADLRQIVGIKEAVAGIAEFFEGEYHSGITGIVDASKVRGEREEDECRPEFDHCYVTQGGGGFDGDDFHGTVYFHIGNGEYATVDY